jgi:hypothetical protein
MKLLVARPYGRLPRLVNAGTGNPLGCGPKLLEGCCVARTTA